MMSARLLALRPCRSALTVIAGQAIHEGLEHAVAVRVAEHDGAIYLDLADEQWRAVRVAAAGWEVIADPAVKFIRRRGLLSLPEPVRGGCVEELRPLVNLPDDDGWILFVAWLLAALRPAGRSQFWRSTENRGPQSQRCAEWPAV